MEGRLRAALQMRNVAVQVIGKDFEIFEL